MPASLWSTRWMDFTTQTSNKTWMDFQGFFFVSFFGSRTLALILLAWSSQKYVCIQAQAKTNDIKDAHKKRESESEGDTRKRKHEKWRAKRMWVFHDTAGVYRAKWLCLSIQLKWIKEGSEWQNNLARLAIQFPQPDLLPLLRPLVPTSALLPLLLFPFSFPMLICAPLPVCVYVTLNLLFHFVLPLSYIQGLAIPLCLLLM